MKVRDLFILIIKILGIYSLIFNVFNLFTVFPSTVSYLQFEDSSILFLSFTLLPVFFSLLLIFKADKFVDILKLSNHFENQEINIQTSSISQLFTLGIIIIGGYLIIDNVVPFLRNFMEWWTRNPDEDISISSYNVKTNFGIKILVGFILMTKAKQIASWVSKFSK